MRLRIATALLALLWVAPAQAQCIGFQCPPGVLGAAGGGGLPLDILPTATGAYSFPKLRSAYTGSAIRIRRTSDNAELDIAPWDAAAAAAAAAHCAATTCFGRTWYDQSGGTRHLQQATAGNQPQLIFNCTGAMPCWQATASTQTLTAGGFTPATGVMSFSVVANRSVGTGICGWARGNGNANRLAATNAAANSWTMFGSVSGSIVATTATAAVWHAAVAVMNGAATSYVNLDGTTTLGTVTGGTTAGGPGIAGAATTTCNFGEMMFWDNYQVTAAEAAYLIANRRGVWVP